MRILVLMATMVFPVLAEDGPLKVELLSEVTAFRPGETFWVGLHLEHAPETHTYWKHPGIVGLATSVKWEFPAGFVAGEIRWPAPELVTMAGHIAQGYVGETLLMVPVTSLDGFSGKIATLTARVSWMCCGATCHPATKMPFSITLPVGEQAVVDPATSSIFEKFREQVPVVHSDSDPVTAVREEEEIVLTVPAIGRGSDPSEIRFFTADGQVDTDAEQRVRVSGEGVAVMTLTRSKTGPEDAASLPGVVVVFDGESSTRFEVNPRY